MANPTIKAIDKQTLTKVIRPALDAKLEELSKELGIQITAARATYDPDGQAGTFKLELAMISESGEVISRERQDYDKYCSLYGLPEGGLGREVIIYGERLKIAGLRMRARKNNVLLDTCDGSGTQRVAPYKLVYNALQDMKAKSA
ncbi:hypothetical protein [Marinobacter alkaliphilus]|uniref:Uncharacterized protein n=1 Tax=Marinobacter alkaliphilus TaxID=254719 RepID=A0ABZ3E996_9GAMM